MSELSESAGSGPRRSGADGGDGGADAQDRPKLVAVPVPEAQPATARAQPARDDGLGGAERDAEIVSANVARLELERALNGPGAAAPVPETGSASSSPDTGDQPVAGPPPAAPDSAATATAAAPTTTSDPIALAATPELVAALRAELAVRATAEAGLRLRVVEAETRLATRVLLSQRTGETLRLIGLELDRLGALLTQERERSEAAERRVSELERELTAHRSRSDEADRELAALRESVQQLRTPVDDPNAVEPTADELAGEVTPDRLTDALTRLRAATEPIDPASGSPAAGLTPTALASLAPTATLLAPFRTLCRRDPAVAGRLAISLLALQRTAYPHPIAYDLLLGAGRGCLQVTSGDELTEVVRQPSARPRHQIDLQVAGDPQRLAKLLAAGPLRRRLRFGLARVRGDRDRLAALDALLALPLDLPALAAGGMLAEPTTLLSLVAAMVSPEWTCGARFAVSHRDGDSPPTHLLFADGRAPEVTPVAPSGATAAVIRCAATELASVLAGSPAPRPAVEVLGDPAPLRQLQGWIKRAQSA